MDTTAEATGAQAPGPAAVSAGFRRRPYELALVAILAAGGWGMSRLEQRFSALRPLG